MQHWHIYQPRRYRDRWNNIINAECYRPNAELGNFRHVSFDIGPTLAKWMRKHDEQTLQKIIASDNGQALAMPYSHRIMPLVRHEEDLKTQILWGIRWFEHLFKRKPEGMWLPECATNKRVCLAMAKEGIKYTIGAPWQRQGGTSQPCAIKLEDNYKMLYFFYHPFSAEISFQPWTTLNADTTLDYICRTFNNEELILLAYDGELFGHHRKGAEHWAAYLPTAASKRGGMKLLTIADYLKNTKDIKEAVLVENSSWSCRCGLKRWSDGCSCAGVDANGREFPKSYQRPLLTALELLEDKVHEIYVDEAEKYFKDVWEARNDFILIELKEITRKEFFKKHTKKDLSDNQFLFDLLFAEYFVQSSFTSCGWFFANMGIEAEYNIMDAARSAKLVKKATGKDISGIVLKELRHAYNWYTGTTAEQVFRKYYKE